MSQTKTLDTPPYAAVIVKPRCNPKHTETLRAAGIPYYFRERNHDEAIRDRHAQQARDIGRNPWRGQRVDATGAQRPDSGTPVFGWEGAKHNAITLAAIWTDLCTAGYVLVNANLVQKEGDKMSTLYLRFEPIMDEKVPFVLSPENADVLERLLCNYWSHVHVFRNPNGTCTINPAHIVGLEEFREVLDPRSLRMDANGSFRNQKVRRPTPQTTDAQA